MKKVLLFIVIILSLLTATCFAAKEEKIILGDCNWDSIKFHNAVVSYIAKNAYNLETGTISGSTPIVYTALKRGDVDVFMEVWTENIAGYDKDRQAGEFTECSLNFGDNRQGFYVPRYVIEGDSKRKIEPLAPDLRTVADLKRYNHVFRDEENKGRGRIYGAIPGWEIDNILMKKYKYYGLDKNYNYFHPGSDSNLSAAIVAAISKGEPIVAYYWEPTWLIGKYDMVLLQDAPYEPEGFNEGRTAAPSVRVTVAYRKDFEKDYPELARFLSRYRTSSALTAEDLAYIADNKSSYEDAAIAFLRAHPELLKAWLPADRQTALQKVLSGKGQTSEENFFISFPEKLHLDAAEPIDKAVLYVNRHWSHFFDNLRGVLLFIINAIQSILEIIPWWLLIIGVFFGGKHLTGSVLNGSAYAAMLFLVGVLGYWQLMNETLAIVLASVGCSLIIGLPVGIWLATIKDAWVKPILDAMQTMPTFVYMIPAVMLLGPGKVPAVMATVVYAVVPVIRLTSLGIRQVDQEVTEAARAFGSTAWQMLWKVQIPQALPTIMTGVNQTMMMAVAMVVTCAMIGADGLGMEVLIAINRTESGRGFSAGICIVIIAIIIDRLSNGLSRRQTK